MKNSKETLRGRMIGDQWFASLDADVRGELLDRSTTIQLRPGEYLFRQGDEARCLFGLVDGMLKASSLRKDGREAVLTVLEPGSWFGETTVVDGLPRGHDVVAVEASELLQLNGPEFMQLMRNVSFAQAISLLIARHARAVYGLLEDVTLRSTRARIVRRLQRLARGDATMAPTDRRVVRITHDTLAMMVGITRQTLELELRGIAAKKIISLGYGRIDIHDMDALASLVADEQ